MRPIDADALIKEIWIIRGSLQMFDNTQGADLIMHGLWMVEQKINDAPTIDAVEVVHGEWLDEHEDGHGFWVGTCSQCGKARRIDNFCPNCGADMRGTGDETV